MQDGIMCIILSSYINDDPLFLLFYFKLSEL